MKIIAAFLAEVVELILKFICQDKIACQALGNPPNVYCPGKEKPTKKTEKEQPGRWGEHQWSVLHGAQRSGGFRGQCGQQGPWLLGSQVKQKLKTVQCWIRVSEVMGDLSRNGFCHVRDLQPDWKFPGGK